MHTVSHDHTARNPATAVERLDRLRWPSLPWAAKRLARRHGLRAATAAMIAEILYRTEAR